MIAIYCKNNGFKLTEYLPDWNRLGKAEQDNSWAKERRYSNYLKLKEEFESI